LNANIVLANREIRGVISYQLTFNLSIRDLYSQLNAVDSSVAPVVEQTKCGIRVASVSVNELKIRLAR